jgi:glutaredoxin
MAPAPATVTLYRKADGCSLCDDADAALAPLAARLGFTLETIDIASDAELFERYQFTVPVVVANGVQVAAGRIVAATLEPKLRDALGL